MKVREPFATLTAVAVPIDRNNVDTDQIIPARLMRKSRSDGLHGTYLFRDLRFNADGSEKPDFILNLEVFRKAQIVVGAKNYGCGSSRVGAVFAHHDFGIRAIVAEGFGDVFHNACVKFGILPVRLGAADTAHLRRQLLDNPGSEITVDLPLQMVTGPDGQRYRFDLDQFAKECLSKGVSDIGITMLLKEKIKAFENNHYKTMTWLRH